MNPSPTNTSDRLAACLDPSGMIEQLGALLRECRSGHARIEALRMPKVRRNASIQRNPHPMTVLYEADLRDAATNLLCTQRLYAKIYRDGRSALETDRSSLHLAALDMRVWRFPADPGLPQLPALLDAAPSRRGRGAGAGSVELLRYEPESRATLRYTRHARGGHSIPSQTLYAKTFTDARGEAIHRRFQHFWDLADAHPFSVAQPLGYDADTRCVWQASAEGRPLAGWLIQTHREGDARALDEAAARIADAMASLHGAPLSLAGPLRRDMPHWITELGRRSRKIARVAPDMAERVAQLCQGLEAASTAFAAQAPSLIHGDFHPDQIWIQDSGRLVLFDFDEFSLGDPMEDLAEFTTSLLNLEGGAAFAQGLRRAVAQRSPGHFDPRRLDWHLAVQQILQACRGFAFQRAGWREAIEARLAQAKALAAGAGT